MTPIRVLVVDDSAVMRKLISHALSLDPQIQIIGQAPDPLMARELVLEKKPDVIVLDIEMPKMDGLSFLKKLMEFIPTRVLIFSSVAGAGSANALKALELGAIDVLEKPSADVTRNMELLSKILVERVKAVAKARLLAPAQRTFSRLGSPTKSPSVPSKESSSVALAQTTHKVIAIASSTGGTEALKRLFSTLPASIPGIVVTQHMPAGFTQMFAKNLNEMFPFEVKEAQNGDRVQPGRVLLAPGNFHMDVERVGGYYQVKLHQAPLLHGVRPAADYMMKSLAQAAGRNAVGIVLTGMGKDGAEGLLAMKQAGAVTYAQSEKTCVVFGMPAAAITLGAAQFVLDLDDIGPHVMGQLQMKVA
jgi:two-component system chemotaxis response regulator CheB